MSTKLWACQLETWDSTRMSACMNCILCGGSAHFIHVHLLSRLWGSGFRSKRAALHFSCSSHQRTLPRGPDPRKQRGEGLGEQRPEQACPTRSRNSFPSLFRVPSPKRRRYTWVHNASLTHLWETAIRLEQERQSVQCQARPSEPPTIIHTWYIQPSLLFSLGDTILSSISSIPSSSPILVNTDNSLQQKRRSSLCSEIRLIIQKGSCH